MRIPRDTQVVVVGINQYRAGAKWTLEGPAEDGLRFVRFFLDQGVPAGNITLLLSPEPPTDELPAGVRCRPADRGTVRDVFLRELPASANGALCVIWGGHGFLDAARHRRLFVADAVDADPVDLDLDSLLATYVSDLVPALHRQLWIVDACQLYGTDGGLRVRGHESFPVGAPAAGRSQNVLFAAAHGQEAANLSRARTGLFSREVLGLLNTMDSALLDDPDKLMGALRERFVKVRASELSGQIPTYLWYRDAQGNEGLLLDGHRSKTSWAAAPAVHASPAELKPVVEALLAIPEFRAPGVREQILSQLPVSISGSLWRYDGTRVDAIAILRACENHPGSLRKLVGAVRLVAGDRPDVDRLQREAALLPAWSID